MTLAINVIDRHGPSNEMRRHLQPKKTKVRLYYSSKRGFTCSLSLTRRRALVLKVGVLYRWKLARCTASYSKKEDKGQAVLSVYITTKDVLAPFHY